MAVSTMNQQFRSYFNKMFPILYNLKSFKMKNLCKILNVFSVAWFSYFLSRMSIKLTPQEERLWFGSAFFAVLHTNM